MKDLIVLIALIGLFPLQSIAGEIKGKEGKSFSEMKQSKIEWLDRLKTCVSNSDNFQQLRNCRKNSARKKNKS